MKARIHVNQHHIKFNRKSCKDGCRGETKPVLTVKTYKSNTYADEVIINGPSKVIYSPAKPLPCGAQVWIECDYEDVQFLA